MNGTILLVDDEPHITRALQRELRNEGYTIHRVESATEALDLLSQQKVDLIISDQRMPKVTGSEFLAKVQTLYPDTVRVLLSGYADFQSVVDAINNGSIYKFWTKPWDSMIMRQQVREAFEEAKRIQRDTQFRSVMETAVKGVIVTDITGTIQSANAVSESMTGYTQNELISQNFFDYCLASSTNKSRSDIFNAIKNLGRWQGEATGVRKDGSEFIQSLSITGLHNEHNEIGYLGIYCQDISEQVEQENKSRFLAYRDIKTGIPNRIALNDRIQQAFADIQTTEEHFTLVSLEIQGYSQLVANLPVEMNEKLHLAIYMQLEGLSTDIVFAASQSASEFVLLLDSKISKEESETLISYCADSFLGPFQYDETQPEIYLRMAIGAFHLNSSVTNVAVALQHVNHARQQSVELGTAYNIIDNISEYEPDRRWLIEQALPKALAQDEFSLAYQPKVDTLTGEIRGMEALLRWNHPEWGFISPDEFIPIAEETGLIIELGKWVLYTACEQTRVWHQQGFSDLCLAVNLSARQMQDPALISSIEAIISSVEYPAHLLEIEITETYALNNDSSMMDIMNKLRRMGISIAADDFGTGYASIDFVKRFPFTTLKIDRCFVRDLLEREDDVIILESILTIAKRLNMTVVIEGVETQEQYELLKSKGCDLLQGYLFSKPLHAAEFQSYIENNSVFQRIA